MAGKGEDKLNKKRWILTLLAVTFFLFINSILYQFIREEDPYRYFTGIGDRIALSPNDSTIAFSYYHTGEEALYEANINGSNVKKLTSPSETRHRSPSYSPNGEFLLFLSANHQNVQSLWLLERVEGNIKRLSPPGEHVAEATFSSSGEEIYYIATSAEDFLKPEGETTEGYDLFSVNQSGTNHRSLTNKDFFSMSNLIVSKDGTQLFYVSFDHKGDRIYSYNLEDGTIATAHFFKQLSGSVIAPSFALSPDEKQLAYITVTEESRDSSLFRYELFLLDLNSGQTKQLTNTYSSTSSPVFFHHEKKIMYLEQPNWPGEPADYRLSTVNLQTKEPQPIALNMPVQPDDFSFWRLLDEGINGWTVALLYILLLCLASIYTNIYLQKGYLPAVISLILTILVLLSSFIVAAAINPWYGIGLGMIALSLAICTVFVFLFIYIFKRLSHR